MKTIIFLIATYILSINSLNCVAENGTYILEKHPEKYCAKLKDGMLVVMHEGTTITTDVTLSNGTVIKTDGTIMKKDGSTTALKEDECMDKDGKIMKENPKTKTMHKEGK